MEKTSKSDLLKPLHFTLESTVQKREKDIDRTLLYRGDVTLVSRCGIEVPTTTDIEDEELRDIIRRERG